MFAQHYNFLSSSYSVVFNLCFRNYFHTETYNPEYRVCSMSKTVYGYNARDPPTAPDRTQHCPEQQSVSLNAVPDNAESGQFYFNVIHLFNTVGKVVYIQ